MAAENESKGFEEARVVEENVKIVNGPGQWDLCMGFLLHQQSNEFSLLLSSKVFRVQGVLCGLISTPTNSVMEGVLCIYSVELNERYDSKRDKPFHSTLYFIGNYDMRGRSGLGKIVKVPIKSESKILFAIKFKKD